MTTYENYIQFAKQALQERLKELNLFNLSKRRLRGNLIKIFKIFRGSDNISINDYVTIDLTSTTCNNIFEIIGNRFRQNKAKHFFFNRIVNIWNSLPAQIVNNNTIETFKKRFDKHLALICQIKYFILEFYIFFIQW